MGKRQHIQVQLIKKMYNFAAMKFIKKHIDCAICLLNIQQQDGLFHVHLEIDL